MNQLITMLLQNHNLKNVNIDAIIAIDGKDDDDKNQQQQPISTAIASVEPSTSGYDINVKAPIENCIKSSTQIDSNSNLNVKHDEDINKEITLQNYTKICTTDASADVDPDVYDEIVDGGSSNNNERKSKNTNQCSFYNDTNAINASEEETHKSVTLNVDSENNFYSVSPSTLTSFESIGSTSQPTDGHSHSHSSDTSSSFHGG